MKIWGTDEGTTHFELTEQENAAIDTAKAIVERRAKVEGGNYSKQMLEWWLCGLLREKGPEGMIRQAQTAPFHKKESIPIEAFWHESMEDARRNNRLMEGQDDGEA